MSLIGDRGTVEFCTAEVPVTSCDLRAQRCVIPTAVLGAGAIAAPAAQAGGDGQVYVYGGTKSQCTTNLDKTVLLYKHEGYTVTGVHGCRLAGDQVRWFGDFIAS